MSLQILLAKGVSIPAPESVWIAPEVDPARIDASVVIHPGCRLSGADLSIGPGCVLGEEAPLTLRASQLGAKVKLAGGFVDRSTFLDGANGGSGAHVRPGCLFEEEASFAHSVGLKQTIFLPFVTAGSLINFCDALMAGGTSRRDHSEIGSSYIHFNFTPHQDKATPSLLGDVPRGVLLDQPPIFLGGQGGMVGPLQIAYGTVIAAGVIQRKDVTRPGQLVISAAPPAMSADFDPRLYGSVKRTVARNLAFIGNLLALDQWYRHVRHPFLATTRHGAACQTGALLRLEEALDERMKRMDELAKRVAESLRLAPDVPAADQQQAFVAAWPQLRDRLAQLIAARTTRPCPETVRAQLPNQTATDYIRAVQNLSPEQKTALAAWLQTVADAASESPVTA